MVKKKKFTRVKRSLFTVSLNTYVSPEIRKYIEKGAKEMGGINIFVNAVFVRDQAKESEKET